MTCSASDTTYSLVGDYTGKSYRPGDRVDVIVAGANPETRQVDLMMVD